MIYLTTNTSNNSFLDRNNFFQVEVEQGIKCYFYIFAHNFSNFRAMKERNVQRKVRRTF